LRRTLPVLALAGAALLGACSIPLPDSRQPLSSDASRDTPAPPEARADAAFPAPPGITEAQSFRGVLPCADCAGQRVTLTLMPDQTWRLRRVYFGTASGKDLTFTARGTWERSGDRGRQLRLIGDANEGGLYEFMSTSQLRVLDLAGRPITSSLNYTLTQLPEVDPIPELRK
jgi:hypothetical protein